MRVLLLITCIASISILATMQNEAPYSVIGKATTLTNKNLVTRGFAFGGKLCSDKCIEVRGLAKRGSVTVAGTVIKKGGEAVLIVRRVE